MIQEIKTAITAALFLLIPFVPAHADIYQFTDNNGVLHFTNVNGGGKKQKRVKSDAGRHTSASEAPQAPGVISSSNMPSDYIDIIKNACDRHGVDPSLIHAVVKVESDFNPYALSRKGAMGLMQLMPRTAAELNVQNSFDPTQNIDGGVKYLRSLIDRYEGNLSLALAAYNAGETAVKRWGTIPPFKETQNYVKRILGMYNGTGSSLRDSYVTSYTTIYMGYNDDGSLVVTDKPTSRQYKQMKRVKKDL